MNHFYDAFEGMMLLIKRFLSLRLTTLKHIQGPLRLQSTTWNVLTFTILVFQVHGMFSLTTEG